MRNGGRRSFRQWLTDFMWERNGYDGLGRALWILALILVIINIFVGSVIISLIESAVVIYALFRFFLKILKRDVRRTPRITD